MIYFAVCVAAQRLGRCGRSSQKQGGNPKQAANSQFFKHAFYFFQAARLFSCILFNPVLEQGLAVVYNFGVFPFNGFQHHLGLALQVGVKGLAG